MKKNLIILISSLLISATAVIPLSASLLSPGLDVIEQELTMTMNDTVADGIDFTYDDFRYATGSKTLEKITVETLPSKDIGTLYLGELEVMKNQVIGAANLSMLRFESSGTGAGEAMFKYTADVKSGSYSVDCILYLLEKENSSPTISENLYCNKLKTYRNVSATGKLTADDEENDELTYTIISKPKNGSVAINNSNGIYIYTPEQDYNGKDSFRFCAEDKYGNRSAAGTVNISVLKTKISGEKYNIRGHWAEANIITLLEKDVIAHPENIDPDNEISRTDFLVLCLNACGKDYLKDTVGSKTIFKDETDIPKQHLGYVAEAYSKGYISGVQEENDRYFKPLDTVTRQEAAVMVKSVFALQGNATRNVFSDQTEISDWSKDAIYTLESLGIITKNENGDIEPTKKMTFAEAAKIISSVIE